MDKDKRIQELQNTLGEAITDLVITRNNVWRTEKYDPKWEGVADLLSENIETYRSVLNRIEGESK